MKSFFFNAEPTDDLAAHPTGYDREYDADSFAAFFAPMFSDAGVMAGRNADACKVVVDSGNTLRVSAGNVYVRGRMAAFDGAETITVTEDCKIIARMNKTADVRGFQLLAVTELVQTEDIYDLELASVTLTPVAGGYEAVVEDTRSFLAYMGQPAYYPATSDDLPYVLWLYTLGFPMTPEQRSMVESNHSLMEIFRASIGAVDALDKSEKATTEEAQAGTNDTKYMTPSGVAQTVTPIVNAFWVLLKGYETAGAFTWTAPDLNNGKPYQIGIMIIGAGGSGAAAQKKSSDGTWYGRSTGGASGYTRAIRLTVTPGDEYSGIVGEGGAPVSGTDGVFPGIDGGSSAFSGITAQGGQGGSGDYQTGSYDSALGAQCSLLPMNDANPFGGLPAATKRIYDNVESKINTTNFGYPLMCFNPFTGKAILGAGGWASGSSSRGLGGKDPDTGLGGGDGAATGSTGGCTAKSANAPGCGGGAAAGNSTGLVTSGAGADGAVYIYVMGVYTNE